MPEHDWAPELRRRLAHLDLDPALEASVVEELAQHLEDRRQTLLAGGMGEDAATAATRAELDGARLLEPRLKELRRTRPRPEPLPGHPHRRLAGCLQDLRYALRGIRRNPLVSSAAVVTLALGIAANTAVFAVLNGVLLKPLPFPQASELLAVWHTAPGAPGLSGVSGDLRLSGSMYFTYAEHNRTFQAIGLWYLGSASVTGAGDPEQVRTLPVTDGTLQVLGMAPILGRWLSAVDQQPGGVPTVMLGHGYWQRRFGGDPDIVGRLLTVDARPREIVGVMPAGFRMDNHDPDLIVPMALDRSTLRLAGFGFQAVGRLRPDATLADANADVERMVPIWMRSWPAAPGVDPLVYETWRIAPALRPLKDDVVGSVTGPLWALMGSVGLVMLVVCANVATLLLARADGRRQEFAVRAALGAGRVRLALPLLFESLWLAAAGTVIGIVLASWGLRAVVSRAPAGLPRVSEIAIDPFTIAFTLALSLASAFFCGLLPALRYSTTLAAGLGASGRHTAGRQRQRTRHGLVVCQVSLALVLVVASALMIRTAQALRDVPPGFTDAGTIQTVRLSIPASLVREPEAVARTQQRLVDAIVAIPGVTGAAFANAVPMEGVGTDWDLVEAEGIVTPSGEIPPLRVFKYISPGFFATMGTRLVGGHDFTWTDLYDRRSVVIVSESMARELWGSASAALGRRIRTLPGAPWREIVGVADDVFENGSHAPAPAIVYWPSFGEGLYRSDAPNSIRTITLVARSERAGTEAFLADIRAAVWSVHASLPATTVQTMAAMYERSMARTSMTMVLFVISGSVALLLSIVALVGVVSYGVSQRTHEIGIRMALGAGQSDVRRMFVRQGLALAMTGTAIGAATALILTRGLSSLLFGVDAHDPTAFAAGAGLVVATALAASWLPAHRAASVDPSVALRAE